MSFNSFNAFLLNDNNRLTSYLPVMLLERRRTVDVLNRWEHEWAGPQFTPFTQGLHRVKDSCSLKLTLLVQRVKCQRSIDPVGPCKCQKWHHLPHLIPSFPFCVEFNVNVGHQFANRLFSHLSKRRPPRLHDHNQSGNALDANTWDHRPDWSGLVRSIHLRVGQCARTLVQKARDELHQLDSHPAH